jgi:hypothetical protein
MQPTRINDSKYYFTLFKTTTTTTTRDGLQTEWISRVLKKQKRGKGKQAEEKRQGARPIVLARF